MKNPGLTELATLLDTYLEVERFPEETVNGVYRLSSTPIQRLGLALEPFDSLYALVEDENLDALFLHRPWRIETLRLPPGVGILSYHLPFDEKLAVGYNLPLAERLGLTNLESLGSKKGRPLGMIGNLSAATQLTPALSSLFDGLERVEAAPGAFHQRIAIVGAMTPALVSEAATRGASAYITGAWRERARRAVEGARLDVWIVGHERSELWGLSVLRTIIEGNFSNLEVRLVAPKQA